MVIPNLADIEESLVIVYQNGIQLQVEDIMKKDTDCLVNSTHGFWAMQQIYEWNQRSDNSSQIIGLNVKGMIMVMKITIEDEENQF